MGTTPIPKRSRHSGSVARVDATGVKAISVFADLDPGQLSCVAEACRELEVEAGTKLVEEGEFGYAMFAVVTGAADVLKGGEYLRTLGPGDVFGEVAVFYGGRRTATVVAKTPMKLVMLFNGELWRLEREVPEVADVLRASVADRLGVA
jgi:CRP-like cAMP-binding protein